MHKIINIDFSIRFDKKNENLVSVNFKHLQIEIENKLFLLTSYEDRGFTYDLNKGKILEKNKIFVFMHGKEFLISPEALFVSKNKVLLEKEILNKIKEHENKSQVSEEESKRLIKDLEENNKKNLNELYLKLIDISLYENDIDLFEALIKQKRKFLKG